LWVASYRNSSPYFWRVVCKSPKAEGCPHISAPWPHLHFHNISTIFLQFFHNFSTIFPQFFLNFFATISASFASSPPNASHKAHHQRPFISAPGRVQPADSLWQIGPPLRRQLGPLTGEHAIQFSQANSSLEQLADTPPTWRLRAQTLGAHSDTLGFGAAVTCWQGNQPGGLSEGDTCWRVWRPLLATFCTCLSGSRLRLTLFSG